MHARNGTRNGAHRGAGPMSRGGWRVAAAGGTVTVALLLAACGSSSSTSTTSTTAASTASTSGSGVVGVATGGTHGTILVTKAGATLYRYSPDGTGNSTCTGQCAAAWPPLTVPAGTTSPAAGPGVPAAELGTVPSSGGMLQVTFKKMPLYTFSGDSSPGQAAGQGVGGVWFVVPVSTGTSGSGGSATTTTTAAHAGSGY